jgi:hypothetical protein
MKKNIGIIGICLSMHILSCSNHNNNEVTLEQLKSVPYVSWSDEESDEPIVGVTVYNLSQAYQGYQLYFNRMNRAHLLDMNGSIVHTWFFPLFYGEWEYGILKENGNIVAYCIDQVHMELDWDSRIVWYRKMKSHHDVEMLPDGSYLVPDSIRVEYNLRSVIFNTIKHLSPTGELLYEWSLWDHFNELHQCHASTDLDRAPADGKHVNDEEFDYYHLNTIKVIPDNMLGKKDNRFREGNWIICLRNVDLICIIDQDTKEVVWHWGPGEIEWPHMPVMLHNGHILLFDNGMYRKYSRVIEINPATYKITWSYQADPPEDFYSEYWGSAQRLPNNNTLITDSQKGYVFEITGDGEKVWEYYNPEIIDKQRKIIYRMIRYPKLYVDQILDKHPEHGSRNGIIANSGFEEELSIEKAWPANWNKWGYIVENSILTLDSTTKKEGEKSAFIKSVKENDTAWSQLIKVDQYSHYRLSGWIKTENIDWSDDESFGAYLAIEFDNEWPIVSQFLSGSMDWTYVDVEFDTEEYTICAVECRVGSNGKMVKGNAWFDSLLLEKM